MLNKASRIILPPQGKQQVNLELFNYNIKYQNSLFTIYLPCAKEKPYYNSTTHSYLKSKLNENIPFFWRKLIHICTISEVIGIVPEVLETRIFSFYRDKYYYEHYPSWEEGDIQRTSSWLKIFIGNYGTLFNYGYCTSKIFRLIANFAELECFPLTFRKESALFEFRKNSNVQQLANQIINDYKKLLNHRFNYWKSKENHAFKVIKYVKKVNPISLKEFKRKFPMLKNPLANISTFCNESKSDKGIFLYYSKKDKKYHFPNFIQELLSF